MNKSKFLRLNITDFIKGLFVAFISALLTALITQMEDGGVINWRVVIYTGIISGLSYILKNLFENHNGEILKK